MSTPKMKGRPGGQAPSADEFAELDSKLLALGGQRVARWPVEDRPTAQSEAAELLVRGVVFTLPVQRRRGKPNRCYSNAAGIWGDDIERYKLVIGYALARGVWREHSWVVDEKWRYETTVVAEKYYGMILNPMEAVKFWWSTYLPERYPGPMSLLSVAR
jgi:hypothetical protein